MRKVIMGSALAASLAVAGLVTPVHAASAAYCTADAGSITYAPPVVSQTFPITSTWQLAVTLYCNIGVSPATGTYYLRIGSAGSETCATGRGAGTMRSGSAKTAGAGTGPITGGWRYTRVGIHYSGDGDIYVQAPIGFHHYKVYLWLDQVPTVPNGVCPGSGGQLIGHATVTEP